MDGDSLRAFGRVLGLLVVGVLWLILIGVLLWRLRRLLRLRMKRLCDHLAILLLGTLLRDGLWCRYSLRLVGDNDGFGRMGNSVIDSDGLLRRMYCHRRLRDSNGDWCVGFSIDGTGAALLVRGRHAWLETRQSGVGEPSHGEGGK